MVSLQAVISIMQAASSLTPCSLSPALCVG